ncbi:unnamed protein product [Somion occarium]|uniref:Mediator of RNA polymerase II transcription subunit 4 n=1 Tax=Somion occarium TaxID=3059160 RepID=A0ABP1E294_9APHY
MSSQPIAGPSSSQMSIFTPSYSQSSIPNVPGPTHTPPTASMSETLLAPLNDLQNLAQYLFLSLSSAQARPIQPPPISAFFAVDGNLAAAVQLSRRHQVKQRKIERLKNEVLELEGRWREIVESLEKGKKDLEEIIVEGDERMKAIEEANARSVPYPELLTYASRISAFTSAPPNMPDMSFPGQPPPPLFFPPFPNEEKMRRGRMNEEEPLGLLGETHPVGKPPTVSPTKSVGFPGPGAGPGVHPYRPDHRQAAQVFDLDLDLNPDL